MNSQVYLDTMKDPQGRMVLKRAEALERTQWGMLELAMQRDAGMPTPAYRPGEKSLIAIIDSGWVRHEEMEEDRVVARYNAADGSTDITDTDTHGTHLAGIIAGTGTPGAGHGFAPGANLIIIKTARLHLGAGEFTESIPVTQVIRGLEWLVANRPGIEQRTGRRLGAVCLATATPECSLAPGNGWRVTSAARAILRLREAGVLTVAGAGNSYHTVTGGRKGMHWPAILPPCISVGATYDKDFVLEGRSVKADEITYYSNRVLTGDYQTTLFAPGSVIRTTGIKTPTAIDDSEGTSSATPIVAASVVLAQELYYLRKKSWPSADSVVARLRGSAKILRQASGEEYRLLSLSGLAKTGWPE